jgi:hypothetical protein
MAEERKHQAPAAPQARPDTVAVPANEWARLQERLATLENVQRVQGEQQGRPTVVLDGAWEATKAELARPAKDRTQEAADKKYGTAQPRFRVRLDSTTDDGKRGPNISEHPELEISANSDLEAGARWAQLCGVRKHDYKLVATPVAA